MLLKLTTAPTAVIILKEISFNCGMMPIFFKI